MKNYERYYLADAKVTVEENGRIQGEFRIAGKMLNGISVTGNSIQVIEIKALYDLQEKYSYLENLLVRTNKKVIPGEIDSIDSLVNHIKKLETDLFDAIEVIKFCSRKNVSPRESVFEAKQFLKKKLNKDA